MEKQKQELEFLQNGPKNLTLLKRMLSCCSGAKTEKCFWKMQTAREYRDALSRLHNGLFATSLLYDTQIRLHNFEKKARKKKYLDKKCVIKKNKENEILLQKCLNYKVVLDAELHTQHAKNGYNKIYKCKVELMSFHKTTKTMFCSFDFVQKPNQDNILDIPLHVFDESILQLQQVQVCFERSPSYKEPLTKLCLSSSTCRVSCHTNYFFYFVVNFPFDYVVEQQLHEKFTLPYLTMCLRYNNVINHNECILQDFVAFLKKQNESDNNKIKNSII